MKNLILVLFALLFTLGCARVNVGGTEKPIKVDVTMRVDIYQHVVKQADDIENLVRSDEPAAPQGPQSFLRFFENQAWAADYSPKVLDAISSRKDRLDEVNAMLSSGAIGEDNQGLLAVRKSGEGNAQSIVNDENADRMTIYKELAKENSSSVAEIQEIYAKKMQSLAPAGSPIQGVEGNWSNK